MKIRPLLTALICLAIMFSCKKDYQTPPANSPINETVLPTVSKPACPSPVKQAMEERMQPYDLNDIYIEKSTVYDIDTNGLKVYKIPFMTKDSTNSFALVAMDGLQHFVAGAIVDFFPENHWPYDETFTGNIVVSSLSHTNPVTYRYVNSVPVDSKGAMLMSWHVGISLSTWLNLQVIYGINTGIPHGVYYVNVHSSGGGGNGGTNPPPNCVTPENVAVPVPPVYAPLFDYSDTEAGIDLEAYFRCFDNVSSSGATYSIKLSTDLPINGRPNSLVSGTTPGHVFITMTKTNGSNSVTQSFGFYPKNGIWSIFNAPVDSKVVDDGQHEFNASMTMNISPAQFVSVRHLAINYANTLDYDLNDFNCGDFALYLFNNSRPVNEQIQVPDWIVPSGYPSRPDANFGTTPNGIYKKLKEMKDANHPEASNIQLGTYTAPTSHGPC
jgi:hypothetical protein